jgi:DNA replication protein DnaC
VGYNRDNYARIREAYETKYKDAQNAADARRAEAEAKIEGLALVNRQLSSVGMRIMAETLSCGGNCAERIADIRRDNEKLLEIKRQMLINAGYPADYTDIKYECEKCMDSGFVDGYMCDCMRQELIMAGYESSGIANLLRTQTFDSFSLDYYKSNADAYSTMATVLEYMKKYAENFKGKGSSNLLMMGGTGLGKTHLSTAMARTLIENANDVVYESAQNIISDFESDRFRHGYDRGDENASDKYFDCDLLIIDDLGVEVINSFSISCIYNLLNTRINKARATVISTNMTPSILRSRYDDRITSRLLGEFSVLLFSGTDVRSKK